jgi:hypothetical protein
MRFQRFNNYADPIGWSSYREGCYQYESPNYFGVNSGWLFNRCEIIRDGVVSYQLDSVYLDAGEYATFDIDY